MIGVEELAALVGRRVRLRRIAGKRWRGLCPFHDEETPSFDVYEATRGDHRGRWHCHSCGADGDEGDWRSKVLKEKDWRPGPWIGVEARLAQEERNFAEIEWQGVRDRYPDLPEEARAFIKPDLRESLLRRLGNVKC